MKVSDKIKTCRKRIGLTQTELGERLGVQKNAVSKWETGKVSDIPAGKIKAMAALFDVPPSYLIDDEAEEPEKKSRAEEIAKLLEGASDDKLREIVRYIKFTLNEDQ